MDAASSSDAREWADRLRRAMVILLVSAVPLGAAVRFGELSVPAAILVLICIAAAALVPLRLPRLRDVARDGISEPRRQPVEAEMVRSVIGGLPDPVVLLDRAGRALQFNVAAAELAPALRLGEPVQSALRAPEIIATLRKALASGRVQRVDYVHH